MTQKLSPHWRRHLWILGLVGLAAMGLLLWQLPFPSSLLVVGMALVVGQLRIEVETLNRWRKTELEIEQDIAEMARRAGKPTTH